MEQTMNPSLEQRPLWPALLVSFGLGIVGLLTLGASLLLARSDLGGALILLARHALKLVPPLVWPAAGLVSVLWLVVMARAWRGPAQVMVDHKQDWRN